MDETPELGSASAGDSPGIASQLIFRPAATTRASYSILRPDEVATEEVPGENVATFSGIWEM